MVSKEKRYKRIVKISKAFCLVFFLPLGLGDKRLNVALGVLHEP